MSSRAPQLRHRATLCQHRQWLGFTSEQPEIDVPQSLDDVQWHINIRLGSHRNDGATARSRTHTTGKGSVVVTCDPPISPCQRGRVGHDDKEVCTLCDPLRPFNCRCLKGPLLKPFAGHIAE